MAALCVIGLLSGCAAKNGASWSSDKPVVVDSLKGLNSNQQEQHQKIAQLEQQVIELDEQVKKQQAIIEAISAGLESVKQTRSSFSSPTAQRQKKLADKLKQVEASLQGTGAATISANAEKNAYTNAYLALKSGRYDEATGAFKALLGQYPDGEYRDQALYWLGESYLALNKPKDAAGAFSSVIKEYPASAKYAAALLKLATAYQSMERTGDAKATLQRLITEQPDSSLAAEARTMLKKIQGTEQ